MKKLIALLLLVMVMVMVACDTDISVNGEEMESLDISEASLTELKPIYEDDMISVSFVKKNDMFIQGMFEFYLCVENKTDQQITVYLQDAYMNNTMFMVGSGVPCDLLPQKNRTHGFTGKFEGTGINGADEISKIGFSIWVVNEKGETMLTTEAVEIIF